MLMEDLNCNFSHLSSDYCYAWAWTEKADMKKVMADFNAYTNWHGTYVKVERWKIWIVKKYEVSGRWNSSYIKLEMI